jgi:hypothetical protein
MASNNTTNTNINSNLFNDMSNSDILFINILNTMYNDNLKVIYHLMDQNNEITGQLIDVFNNRRRQAPPLNNSRTYAYTRNPNNNRNTNRPNQMRENINNNNNNNNNNNQRRVYIDNVAYYVDDLQLFTIPNTTTNTRNTATPTTTNTRTNANITNEFSRNLNSFLEPVNITPTPTQIENATRNIVYGDILDPINNSCPISLESFIDTSNVTMIRHCRHIFNRSSLMSWFNSNCKCPVCRYDIRNYNPNNNNNNNQPEEEEEENEGEEIDSDNNPQSNEQNRLNANATNLNNNNSIETLFVEILSDLSNNNIEYTLDNTSQLFNSLFSVNRRRESRR